MIKRRLAAGEVLVGSFAALGSAVAVEALARAGLDFVIVDLEHGAGDESRVLPQLLAAERGGAHALVRVESTARERTTRALDLGAEGIVAPRVDSAAEADAWAAALRYGAAPGARGVALGTRGAGFGLDPDALDRRPLGVVQIESPAAVAACDGIAGVDGVDVLFVGPSDLSYALGCFRAWDHPELRAATARVVAAAHGAGKAAGTFCPTPAQVPAAIDAGFSLIAVGTDVALLVAGGRTIAASI
ncbi:2,4-dihydroxyhept-2-enedioate aldolase [Solirubrobacter pauli]|uniref:2,4-dihydroxyhept-2-enedioate aldolase n=1 Tax=Solirubrobacter pauli TaxID=166793 RepID=A0A660KZ62_9ACTN|nr:aldolase/citrate lyase family protein [Solirubrobacter pauli]RKQ87011.1 2,4-dihydroxyhept-2-enedioate aldolase [Solirubrobacter pauli]